MTDARIIDDLMRKCQRYKARVAELERYITRKDEALAAVLAHVAPYVRRNPFGDPDVDAALAQAEAALRLGREQ